MAYTVNISNHIELQGKLAELLTIHAHAIRDSAELVSNAKEKANIQCLSQAYMQAAQIINSVEVVYRGSRTIPATPQNPNPVPPTAPKEIGHTDKVAKRIREEGHLQAGHAEILRSMLTMVDPITSADLTKAMVKKHDQSGRVAELYHGGAIERVAGTQPFLNRITDYGRQILKKHDGA